MIFIFHNNSESDDLAGKIYWTGLTRSGCAGQFSECFTEEKNENLTFVVDYLYERDQKEVDIISSRESGACVAIITVSQDVTIAKTMFCQSKALLSCQGTLKTIAATTDQV